MSIWADDRLNRSADALFLKTFLINRVAERQAAGQPASYVLNIDARWGEGKSFFLDRFGKLLRTDGYIVAEVNAWQEDHAEDPLLPVMDAIDQAVLPITKRQKKAQERWNVVKRNGGAIAVAAAKGATIQVAKLALGAGVGEIAQILATTAPAAADKVIDEVSKSVGELIGSQGKAMLDRFREAKRTTETFRKSLAEFLSAAAQEGQMLPLFVLVDEVDRCRPPFAIALLERVKHLFDIDQVVFVVATDTNQLSHSVGAVYGAGFDSQRYLSRFFNRSYQFEPASRSAIVGELLQRYPLAGDKMSVPPGMSPEEFLVGAIDYFGLPLRDVQQVYDLLRTIVTAWDKKVQIELIILLPIVVAHQQRTQIRLDRDFSAHVKKLVKHPEPEGVSWSINFGGHGTRSGAPSVDFAALAGKFVTSALAPLVNALERDAEAQPMIWINQRLGDEFSRITGGVGRTQLSLINTYPSIVRTAGRLAGNADQ